MPHDTDDDPTDAELRELVQERHDTVLISATQGTTPRVHLPREDGDPRCTVLERPREVDQTAVPNADVCRHCANADESLPVDLDRSNDGRGAQARLLAEVRGDAE